MTDILTAAVEFIHARDLRIAARRDRTKFRADDHHCEVTAEDRRGSFSCLQLGLPTEELCDSCREVLPYVEAVAKADQHAANKLEVLRRAVYRAENRSDLQVNHSHKDQGKLF